MTVAAPAVDDGPGTNTLALLGAIAAVTAWGSAGIIIRHLDLSSTEIAIYRFSGYSLLITVFMAARGAPLTLRALRLSLWGGLALGLDVALFFEAVKRTTIANATIIGALQPVVVSAYASRFEGEHVSRRNVVLAAVALAGVVGVIMGSSGTADLNPSGDLMAVGALLAWSMYFVFSKRSHGRLTSTEYTAATALITAAVNVAIAFAIGTELRAPRGDEWFWLIVLAVAAGVVGHSLMNWALVRIPLWLGSTTTLFIPVVAALLAWLILDEALDAVQLVSMVAVVAALALIVRDQTRPR